MSKRGGEVGGSNMSIKRTKSGQDAGIAPESGNEMIPKPLPLQCIHFNFNVKSYEELTSGQLLYFMGCQTPAQIFGPGAANLDAQLKNYYAFAQVFDMIKIHPMSVKCHTFVYLLDEITTSGSTPATTTSITNQVYFHHMCPKSLMKHQYFVLSSAAPGGILTMDSASVLVYDRSSTGTLWKQISSSFDPEAYRFQVKSSRSTYFPAGTIPAAANGTDIRDLTTSRILDRGEYENIHAGGEINFSINSAVNSVYLPSKDADGNAVKYFDAVNEVTAVSPVQAFHWPGRWRPLLTRSQNYEDLLHRDDVNMPALMHHFIFCPPIKNGSGGILKQRISFQMEVQMSVELCRREDYNVSADDGFDQNVMFYDLAQWNISPFGSVSGANPPVVSNAFSAFWS